MIKEIQNDIKKFFSKYGKIVKLILIFFMFYFFDYVTLIPIKIFNITDISGPTTVLLSTFKSALLAIVLFLIYRKDLIKDWDKFRSNPIDNLDSGIKYWFLGLVGMIGSNLLINIFFKPGGAANEQAVQSLITALPWMMLLNAGIIAPFAEEMVFRKAFKDAINNKWLYVLLSGFVFGGLHVLGSITNWYDILYIFPYSFLGLAFAFAHYETDTIFTSIILHTIHNSVLILSSITIGMII